MLLKKDLKWSPDGIQVRNIPAGEYETGSLPERVIEVATQIGIIDGAGLPKTDTPIKPKPGNKRSESK
ncbi:hypothetical protein LL626_000673 [Salmonella enterica]|uniref:Bacteriophage protein n=1 Tax=Salmonella enterica TaxID=28901 RepID=A0A5V3ALA9_SALER|nr:hypothetical protein [Salmonella enterica]EBX0087310.1 hypothetical protein [Salmonella enterica subsp. enterica serovar Miami]EDW5639753.1 hypothetical protein [Salmonella enterica subsp. enterica serovar Saintpaul]EAZ3492646.1 hypothetical protein [Salmonella enterica]EBL7710099.1 hypothetical protein [Salmonella enterica]